MALIFVFSLTCFLVTPLWFEKNARLRYGELQVLYFRLDAGR